MWFRDTHSPFSRRRSVSDDWVAALPTEKTRVFENVLQGWETSYAMLSVSLDDAFSLRARGELICSRQQISVTSDLLTRLTNHLLSFCQAVQARSSRLMRLPAVAQLKMDYFRGATAQTAASWNGILHHVLFGSRARFRHKVRILADTLERLMNEFSTASGDICSGTTVRPNQSWDTLDALHYDFNTCLRETEIVLKSFLLALPEEQLGSFVADLEAPPQLKPERADAKLHRASA